MGKQQNELDYVWRIDVVIYIGLSTMGGGTL